MAFTNRDGPIVGILGIAEAERLHKLLDLTKLEPRPIRKRFGGDSDERPIA